MRVSERVTREGQPSHAPIEELGQPSLEAQGRREQQRFCSVVVVGGGVAATGRRR